MPNFLKRDRNMHATPPSVNATLLTRVGRPVADMSGESPAYVNPPVVRGSTVLAKNLREWRSRAGLHPAERPMTNYGRFGTPTTRAFEEAMAELECAYRSICFASGLAACTHSLLAFLRPSSHVLMAQSVYWPMRDFASGALARLGCVVEFYDELDAESLARRIRPETSVVYLEAPGSLSFEVAEVDAIAARCRAAGVRTIMDNTWATPVLFRPLAHGIDVSVQSATKYIAGHSDCILGVASSNEASWPAISSLASQFGQTASPDDTYQALRGLRTLAVRLQRHEANAAVLIDWLLGQPEVARVCTPTLPGHPGHANWARLFEGASGLFSFALHPLPDDALEAFFDALQIFGIGLSWGGYESLVVPVSPVSRHALKGLDPRCTFVRMHAGLEAVDDLVHDLRGGFGAMRARIAAHALTSGSRSAAVPL